MQEFNLRTSKLKSIILVFILLFSLCAQVFSNGKQEGANAEGKSSVNNFNLPKETKEDVRSAEEADSVFEDIPLVASSGEKTLSTYKGGFRYMDFGEQLSGNGVVFTSTVKPAPRPDYSDIDHSMRRLDIPKTVSIEQAARQIIDTAPCSSTLEKIRAIYSWIAYHVDYDVFVGDAEDAFKSRYARCEGYSKLMKAMCDAVGIKCDIVEGIAIQSREDKANVYVPGGGESYHAWNKVCVDEKNAQYILVDVTWSSKGTFSTGKDLDDKWFATDPCYFIFSHYTYGSEVDSLLSPTIDEDIFVSLPLLDPSFEKFGIDGKELLEFMYSHIDSTVPDIYFGSDYEAFPDIYKIPMSAVLLPGEEYELAYKFNGQYVSKIISPDDYIGVFFEEFGWKSIQYFYGETYTKRDNRSDLFLTAVPEAMHIKEPVFEYYDDKIEIDLTRISFQVGDWLVYRVSGAGYGFWFYESEDARYPSAIFNVTFQRWNLVSGHYYSGNFDNSLYYATKPFDEDLEQILSSLIVKVDPSIPLDRTGIENYQEEYNVVFVPLSRKDQVIDSVLNYDWTKDREFADFVYWMEKHDIPEEQIEFYKEMAKFPMQRGNFLLLRDEHNTDDVEQVGMDRKVGEDGANGFFNVGGMEQFFYLRNNETRYLLRNKTIPVLLVHIKDSEGSPADISQKNYEQEAANIKKEFEASGLDNTLEMYTAEIEMKYSDFEEKYASDSGPNRDFRKTYGDAWEDIVAEVAKTDPRLAQKFSDKNKSVIIKYFDTKAMNDSVGSRMPNNKVLLWFIMKDFGYSSGSHLNLFGSEMAVHSPHCHERNCLHDTAVCPLCLYSYGLE